jgi:Putative peptidoglycan binding domain
MASRWIALAATTGLVGAMIAPALAQSTRTGSAPATGSGSGTPSSTPAPSATQPGSITQPSTPPAGMGSGATGKAKSGTNMGQSGTSAPSGGTSSMPSSGTGSGAGMGTSTGSTGSHSGMSADGGSEQVKAVQKALQDKGMDPGAVDGIMGPKTMAALKAFQKDQKLTESGRLDDQTREKLGVTR